VRLLLDTHALFWSAETPTKLSPPALAAIQDPANDRLLSAATIWEVAIKVGLGKLSLALPYRQWMEKATRT
jgi:PIN domain nuclease of toxin-antitoxin system